MKAEGNDTPEQAVALAREAVRSGLTDKATAMRLVQEYVAAPGGPFGQLLVNRGLVDQGGLVRLQAAAAAASAPAASAPSMWLPAVQPPRPASDLGRPPASGSGSGGGPVLPSSGPRDSQRLRQPPPEPESKTGRWGAAAASAPPPKPPERPERSTDAPFGLSDRTLAYDPVLKKPGDSGSREFDPILASGPSSGSVDERLTSTASSSRDATGESVDIGVDSVVMDLTTSTESLTQKQPAAGDKLGDYELRGVLGSGGMGVIFEARKAGSDRRYAVKVLLAKQGPSGDARRQRFQREVEVLRRLEHPNIVRLHDAGHHGQYDWYAMDCIEGRELADLLVQGRLSLRQRLDMFVAICRAVAHAHERGVIHRDLKPSNVLIDPNDGIHVLDFGLAKVMETEQPQDLRLTHDGSSLGTPYYMAPEQLIRPKDVDRRADVFALGVLLYEMLAGGRPFVGTTAVEVNDRILNFTPPAPSKVSKEVPAGLDPVCLKALQKDAGARYQDVDALRREVDKVRKTLQAHEAGPSGGELAMGLEWVSRNRDGVIVGFVLATLFYVPLLLIIVVIVRLAR